MLAIEHRTEKVCHLLIEKGAPLNDKDVFGMFVWEKAIKFKKLSVLHEIIKKEGYDRLFNEATGETPLLALLKLDSFYGDDKLCLDIVKNKIDKRVNVLDILMLRMDKSYIIENDIVYEVLCQIHAGGESLSKLIKEYPGYRSKELTGLEGKINRRINMKMKSFYDVIKKIYTKIDEGKETYEDGKKQIQDLLSRFETNISWAESVDLSVKDRFGDTPISFIFFMGAWDFLEILIKKGAKLDSMDDLDAYKNKASFFKYLVKHPDTDFVINLIESSQKIDFNGLVA